MTIRTIFSDTCRHEPSLLLGYQDFDGSLFRSKTRPKHILRLLLQRMYLRHEINNIHVTVCLEIDPEVLT